MDCFGYLTVCPSHFSPHLSSCELLRSPFVCFFLTGFHYFSMYLIAFSLSPRPISVFYAMCNRQAGWIVQNRRTKDLGMTCLPFEKKEERIGLAKRCIWNLYNFFSIKWVFSNGVVTAEDDEMWKWKLASTVRSVVSHLAFPPLFLFLGLYNAFKETFFREYVFCNRCIKENEGVNVAGSKALYSAKPRAFQMLFLLYWHLSR